ncbi:PREDICTED: ribonuclease Z, mitochondrial isoform X2 [Nicrophorus vespilloides]|uniref:ribonuclease Z n=1 Tax=Nicrophorus vespilloides TaxID=110193 RepID=A0ABM1NFE4_NICVS|nr:PREDICTED: ribonuclease Z, mitochondrial isoform X2 [Nicrophorus vespilloides]
MSSFLFNCRLSGSSCIVSRIIFVAQKTNLNTVGNRYKSMPKEMTHVAEAQRQRLKIKEKSAKYVPGKVSLQVLGSGANGAPRSLYIFTDQSRYLFNCGEGTQRLAHEHKMKLAKLEHIFVTQATWKNMGGLPGTALTIQDVGVPKITLHGPKGLDFLFKATKRFVVMKNLKLEMADCEEGSSFSDNVMNVQYVPLSKADLCDGTNEGDKCTQTAGSPNMDVATSTESRDTRKRRRSKSRSRSRSLSVSEDETNYYGNEIDGTKFASNSISEEAKAELAETKEKGVVMGYICRLTPRPGTLCLEKCVKFGVPPGPLLGQLKGGSDVTLTNGTVVKASDVCEPDDPGPVFLVVDCPGEEYLDSLVNNASYRKHQENAVCDEDLAYLVVHFTPKNVMQHPKYQRWLQMFSPSTRHMAINDANVCMGSTSVHRIQCQLNLLSPDIFPLLGDKGTKITVVKEDEEKTTTTTTNTCRSDSQIIQPSTVGIFHLRPRKGYDVSNELKLNPKEYVEEGMKVVDVEDTLPELERKLSEKKSTLVVNEYPKVLFMGTGSCIPNKTRNTSGILLQISDKINVVVDCGEGTYGQVVRFFGEEKSRDVLARTEAIYVSHLHADHHIGLIGYLQGRRRARQLLDMPPKPVRLFAPKQILSWLHFYDLCFEGISADYELIPNGDLLMTGPTLDATRMQQILSDLDMEQISTCYVRHCPNAFGVALRHRRGFKITYSGDTMPSEDLIQLGMGSDLLIHEATMEDELAHEAVVKMHSTTSQAIEVGRLMKARYVLLTHFSQRYAKLPRFNENFTENIGIAFDNMQVKMDELPLVPILYPALKMLFADHYEELETKAVKRQMRLEREKLEKSKGTTAAATAAASAVSANK